MNSTLMSTYIEFIADRLLVALGFKQIFHRANPVSTRIVLRIIYASLSAVSLYADNCNGRTHELLRTPRLRISAREVWFSRCTLQPTIVCYSASFYHSGNSTNFNEAPRTSRSDPARSSAQDRVRLACSAWHGLVPISISRGDAP